VLLSFHRHAIFIEASVTIKRPVQEVVKDDHLKSIGLAIIQWASVEMLMRHIVLDLTTPRARPDDERVSTMMLTASMDVPTLISLLRTFVRMRLPEGAADFDALAERLERAYVHRNILAHSCWESGSTPDHIRPTGYQVGSTVQSVEGEATAADIAAAAAHFLRLGQELRRFMSSRGLVPRTLPDEESERATEPVSNAA
jgi:hypothetical protein